MKTELYKKDSSGKIRVYKTYTDGDILHQLTGVFEGNLVPNSTVCKPKNVGRSNETTGSEQAILEMESRLRSKLDEGYFETIEEANDNVILLPMLAKDYKTTKGVIFPCFAQPKLDGMRCLGKDKLISRAGKEILTMDHIKNDIKIIADILDGELYSHGLSFQENMKLVKKYRKGESEKVKYHVYDVVLPLPFHLRMSVLKNMVTLLNSENIELVETVVINNEEELKSYHAKNVGNGFEGTIVRWGDAPYQLDTRSKNLLKYKDFLDEVFEVVDIHPSERRPTHGIVVCKIGSHTFNATPKMSHSDREELLTNRVNYIGQKAEIRFFEKTDDGFPRFPVCVGFRLDK